MKKIILAVFAATSLLIYSTPTLAFSLSVGVPIGHTYTGEVAAGSTQNESDGSSGYFLGVQLPFAFGIGMDSYKTKIKCSTCDKEVHVSTTMYNLYYQLPIPIITLTIGLGTGKTQLESGGVAGDDGAATQWYTSFGIPIIPLFDLHLSYRSISSKIESTSGSDKGKKDDTGGNVMGLGIGFNF